VNHELEALLKLAPLQAKLSDRARNRAHANIELAYRARADSFVAELKRLRNVCAHAVDPGFATHPNYDHAKHLCAWHALGLMRELSDRKITGTKDSAFRVVTGLLYEAVSGQPDADLKRACDSVLQNVDIRSGTD
jgi:hypothetical protein